jgi:hypothetical protein
LFVECIQAEGQERHMTQQFSQGSRQTITKSNMFKAKRKQEKETEKKKLNNIG